MVAVRAAPSSDLARGGSSRNVTTAAYITMIIATEKRTKAIFLSDIVIVILSHGCN